MHPENGNQTRIGVADQTSRTEENMKRLILFSTMALGSVSVFGQDPLNFSQYPARVEKATARQVNFRSHPKAKTFRTNLRAGPSGGVNFAHYIVATWGCG